MINCLFASDLHGDKSKYLKLFNSILELNPEAVFLGGDLTPNFRYFTNPEGDFFEDFFFSELQKLQNELEYNFPEIFLILGNDDVRIDEEILLSGEKKGLYHYINQRKIEFRSYLIIGYSFIPPSPFQLKDWEKYDVSRYVDPGCTHPTEGYRSVDPGENIEFTNIKKDLENLSINLNFKDAVFLFHSPPYQTNLDRADLDGKTYEYVPLDVNIGSIAIKRFIEEMQPHLTMHGHVHESTRLTGSWIDKIGNTVSFNAAHDGNELSIIKFDLDNPLDAERLLL